MQRQDWRDEQIGLGVSRCPGDNENVEALIERDLLDHYLRKCRAELLNRKPNGTAIFADHK